MKLKLYTFEYGDTANLFQIGNSINIETVNIPPIELSSVNYFNVEGTQLKISFIPTSSIPYP
jgi:hypothetical protein